MIIIRKNGIIPYFVTFFYIFMAYFMAEPFYNRAIYQNLNNWADNKSKPGLILYGARQTGRTSLVIKISKSFRQFIHLDLEEPADVDIFRRAGSASNFLDALFFLKTQHLSRRNTLIFFDGACREPHIVALAEEIISQNPWIKIIISSSLLFHQAPPGFETLFLHPFSFTEFLQAIGNNEAVAAFEEVPFPVGGFHKLLGLFHQYSLVGGMPAVVRKFVQSKSLSSLKPVYEKILAEFYNGIGGLYLKKRKKDLLMITLQNAFLYAGTRIKFNAFGNVPYGSREMAGIFRYLEDNMLLGLYYPSTSVRPPVNVDRNKFPRLHLIDTGLVTYFSGIQKQMILAQDLNSLFEGQVLRHMIGQELLSVNVNDPDNLNFWVRDKAQSSAELDYIVVYGDMIIPVVVKSGEPGRLRSLHQFIDEAPHPYAIRLYAGNVNIRKAVTLRGKPYYLLSLPYFLACRIREHLKGFIRYVGD
jgi:predicted AAA+ superfamily ATPase